ncbi:hypothetical protein EP331_13335 [bacterium]|nr:MAG: hypothetical protein EP331_13335 [bacterium]
MKRPLVCLLFMLLTLNLVSAQEFLTNIKLPKSHDLLDVEAVADRGVYVLSGKVGNGNLGKWATTEVTIHFFNEELKHQWSTGIFEKIDYWGSLKILSDPNTSDVGLAIRNEEKKQWSLQAVLIDSLGNAKVLEYNFSEEAKKVKIEGALISQFGIHVFCEADKLDFSEVHFSFTLNTAELRHTYDSPIVYPEIIGRRGNILLFQDPIYSFCNIYEYDLEKGKPLRKFTISPSNSVPSFLLRPLDGIYTNYNQYSLSSTFSVGSNGRPSSTSYSYNANGSAYICIQWIADKQKYVSFELHSDTIQNKEKVSRRNYFIDGFVIREFDKDMQQLSYHFIPYIESLKEGSARMDRSGAYDKGHSNTFCLFPESDTSYLISAFDMNGSIYNMIRVNTESNQISTHQSSNLNRLYTFEIQELRMQRTKAAYSTVNVNHFPSDYYNWLKKNNYTSNGSKGINTIAGEIPSKQFYFVHYDKYGLSISIWNNSSNVQTTPVSKKLGPTQHFLVTK